MVPVTDRPCLRRRLLRVARLLNAAVSALAFAAAPVRADGPDAQRLRLSPGLDDEGLVTPSARPVWDRPWTLGLLVNHADDPVLARGGGLPDRAVVDAQTTLHLVAAVVPAPRWQLGLEVPLVLAQSGGGTGEPGSSVAAGDGGVGLGDVRAVGRYTVFTTESASAPAGTSLGLGAEIYAPTGDGARYQGEGFRAEGRVLADHAFTPRVSLGGAAGYRFRARDTLANVRADDEFTYAAAVHVGLGDRFAVVPEAHGAVGVRGGAPDREEAPLEALLGLRFFATPGVTLHAGAGTGIVGGFGVPRVRGLVGLSVRRGEDPDHRGRTAARGPVDRCPDAAEDLDGFEDADGCPDLDDDRDGLPDTRDDCRLQPEDRDGFEDDDGCPDPDDDRDGFADGVDACPRVPEDHDGREDADGCPEVDDDTDGVADRADRCAEAPETRNDFRDADGCPDEKPLPIDCAGFSMGGDILFESGQATLLPRSLPLLDRVARTLVDLPEIRRVRLEGFTDDRGAAGLNLDLSQRRVDEVRAHLITRGVSPDRIEARGFGEARPVAPNGTPAGRARNRRVELVVVDREGCPPAVTR